MLLASARIAVLSALLGLLLAGVLPSAVGWQTTVVLTGSMVPAVRPGDVVVAAPLAAADAGRLTPGAILLVADPSRGGRLLLHRLVGRDTHGLLITKGDRNRQADSAHVAPAALRGQARLLVPLAGLPWVWVAQGRPLPLLGLAGAVLALLVWRPGSRGGRRMGLQNY